LFLQIFLSAFTELNLVLQTSLFACLFLYLLNVCCTFIYALWEVTLIQFNWIRNIFFFKKDKTKFRSQYINSESNQKRFNFIKFCSLTDKTSGLWTSKGQDYRKTLDRKPFYSLFQFPRKWFCFSQLDAHKKNPFASKSQSLLAKSHK